MRIIRTVSADKPLEKVFEYFADFTKTTHWDPATVITTRTKGQGDLGTEYVNRSMFLGRETEVTYVVTNLEQNRRIVLRGENQTVVAVDSISFETTANGTEVTYEATFTFKGAAKIIAPFLKNAFKKLGDEAAVGMQQALDNL